MRRKRAAREHIWAVLFLAPSLLGVLVFVAAPLVVSLGLSLTDWDLSRHNALTSEPLRFIGLGNYREVLSKRDNWRFLGNTLFLMLGIPVSMVFSLLLAVLLHGLSAGKRSADRAPWQLACVLVFAGIAASFSTFYFGAPAILAVGGGTVLLLAGVGMFAGGKLYLPLLYLPSFTSGVATFVLWKKLYHPDDGPVNALLRPLLVGTEAVATGLGSALVGVLASIVALGVLALGAIALRSFASQAQEGEISPGVFSVCATAIIGWPIAGMFLWPSSLVASLAGAVFLIYCVLFVVRELSSKRRNRRTPESNGGALLLTFFLILGQGVLLGIGLALWGLRSIPEAGLQPPNWLADYHWAKPALMIMGLWMAVGSNNLLLYMAGLSAVSPELYEAAEMDGAGHVAKLWNITLPELAPVTAFILIMSFIGGLQGGFEMARTMTYGGPAGSTMTLAYAVYDGGFQMGRLGYASALAWLVFVLVAGATVLIVRRGRE